MDVPPDTSAGGFPFQMPRGIIIEGKIRVAFDQAAATFPANLSNHVTCLRLDNPADHRHSRLDDPRLLPRDCRQRVSQLLRMVKADAGDDRDRRLADIGRIEPSTQADFQHGCLNLMTLKVQHGHGRDDFEERGPRLALGRATIKGFDGWSEKIDQCRKFLGLARLAIDGHPLFNPLEVWRGKQARSVSGGRQRCGNHGRR